MGCIANPLPMGARIHFFCCRLQLQRSVRRQRSVCKKLILYAGIHMCDSLLDTLPDEIAVEIVRASRWPQCALVCRQFARGAATAWTVPLRRRFAQLLPDAPPEFAAAAIATARVILAMGARVCVFAESSQCIDHMHDYMVAIVEVAGDRFIDISYRIDESLLFVECDVVRPFRPFGEIVRDHVLRILSRHPDDGRGAWQWAIVERITTIAQKLCTILPVLAAADCGWVMTPAAAHFVICNHGFYKIREHTNLYEVNKVRCAECK